MTAVDIAAARLAAAALPDDEKKNLRISCLGLRPQAENALHENGIHTVGQILERSKRQLMMLNGLWYGSIRAVSAGLRDLGFEWP